jgi:hypothetical protein
MAWVAGVALPVALLCAHSSFNTFRLLAFMRKQYPFLLFGLLLATAVAHPTLAQKNYHPGYIVRPAGDTLRGEVSVRNGQRMAQSCLFRPAKAEQPAEYTPADIKAYGVIGSDDYQAATVPAVAAGSPEKAGFVRVLASGKASVFTYPDADDRPHYYYRLGNEPLTELVQTVQTVKVDNLPVQERLYPFRKVLSQAFADCPAVQSMLVRAELSESQLRSIFNRYNTCGPGQTAAKQSVARRTTLSVSVLGGVQRATMDFSDDGEVALASRFRPVAGLGLMLHPASFSPALALRLEVLYQSQLHESEPYTRVSFSALKTTRNPQIKLSTIRVPLLFRYTLPTRTLRPYVQAGVEVAVLLDKHQALVVTNEEQLNHSYKTSTEEIAVRPLGYGPTGALGLLIPTGASGSVQLEARYNHLDNTSQAVGIMSGARTVSFLAGYNFGR